MFERWKISKDAYEAGRMGLSLKSSFLENAIEDTFNLINTENPIKQDLKYTEYLDTAECIENIESWTSQTHCPVIEKTYPYDTYRTNFIFPAKGWHSIEWAASYRNTMSPGGKVKKNGKWVTFEEQMKQDIQGLLGELFLHKVFKRPFKEFWEKYKSTCGHSDGGMDIILSSTLEEGRNFRADIKTSITRNINVDYKLQSGSPKEWDFIIAPIFAIWAENDTQLDLEFYSLIDIQKFWADYWIPSGQDGSYFISIPTPKEIHKSNLSIDRKPRYENLLKEWNLIPLGVLEPDYDRLHNRDIKISKEM